MTTWVAVVAAYFVLAVVMTHPLFLRMGDHVLITPIDNLLNTWILAWDYHALATQPSRLFDANIFFPARHVLALSEHLLGDLPLFAPVMFLTGNPVLAANAVVFGSFVLSGVAMFALAWHWTRSALPSFVAGFVYAFAPPRIGQIGKWQLLSVQWAPLALLFLDRFLRTRRWRDGLLAAFFYVLQVLSSFYLGYFLTFVMGAYLAYWLLSDRSLWSRRLLSRGLVCAAVAGAIILPFEYPYFMVRREYGLLAPSPDSYLWASTDPALSFLSVPDYGTHPYQRLLARFQAAGPWESWLFPGFLSVLLAGVALGSVVRSARPVPLARWDRRAVWGCVAITIVPIVMSLGPVLVVNERPTGIPLPYALFSAVLPGFSGMRAPARFALMAWVGFSLLVGFGVHVLTRRLADRGDRAPAVRRFREVGLVAGLLLLVAAEFHLAPLPMDAIEVGARVPPVYRWLATQPRDGGVLEVPWGFAHEGDLDPAWRGRHWLLDHPLRWTVGHLNLLRDWITRSRYVYFSVYHWHPIVNGYSGYTPPTYDAVIERLEGFPSAATVDYLAGIGVRRLVVHGALLEPASAARWQSLEPAGVGLKRAAVFGEDVVYEIAHR